MNLGWARLFLAALREAGAGEAFVSPGSRSTPLVLAAVELGLTLHIVIDERAAGFAALGWARASGRPAVLVCTSGSAAAHYLPAIVEAAEAGVPLIALTADRPLELRGCAAPQTTDQVHLFGRFPRAFLDLGPPSAEPAALRALRRRAVQAVAAALGPPAGPVHVDFPFGKPLEPAAAGTPGAADDARMDAAALAIAATPLTRARPARRLPAADDVAALRELIADARRPLVAIGPLAIGEAAAAARLLDALGAPRHAEATSQLAWTGAGPASLGPLLAGRRVREALAPDVVVEIGAPPVAAAWAEVAAGARRAVIAGAGWNDPSSSAELLIRADLAEVADALADARPARAGWRAGIDGLAERAAAVARHLAHAAAPSPLPEPLAIARAIAGLPAGARVLLANSLPVRLADLVSRPPHAVEVLSQRGVAGIDGLIAGAAGAALAAGGPVVALLGDVAFAHDVGGLAVARAVAATPLVLVVIDNGGGRIFDGLPVARVASPAVLERCFTTAPAVDPCAAAAAFGVGARRVTTAAELDATLAAALGRAGATVLHVVVAPDSAQGFLAALGPLVDAACADAAAQVAR